MSVLVSKMYSFVTNCVFTFNLKLLGQAAPYFEITGVFKSFAHKNPKYTKNVSHTQRAY